MLRFGVARKFKEMTRTNHEATVTAADRLDADSRELRIAQAGDSESPVPTGPGLPMHTRR